MTKHMFRCYIGRGKMSATDLETRINDWVSKNNNWTNDRTEHSLRTIHDGEYYLINVRFHEDDTKTNILQKFEDKLKDKVSWYRVGYHVCDHDSTTGDGCSFIDLTEWTAKDVTIPDDIPDIEINDENS